MGAGARFQLWIPLPSGSGTPRPAFARRRLPGKPARPMQRTDCTPPYRRGAPGGACGHFPASRSSRHSGRVGVPLGGLERAAHCYLRTWPPAQTMVTRLLRPRGRRACRRSSVSPISPGNAGATGRWDCDPPGLRGAVAGTPSPFQDALICLTTSHKLQP